MSGKDEQMDSNHTLSTDNQMETEPQPETPPSKIACPFLIGVLIKTGQPNTLNDFQELEKNRIDIHVWNETTLQDLTLLLSNHSNLIQPHSKLIYRAVYANKLKLKQYQTKDLGSVFKSQGGKETLKDLKFNVGDYLDVCIMDGHSMRSDVMDRMGIEKDRFTPYPGRRPRR
ncbi:hypothetical protein HDV02_004401 [Globomyces sp. JEL0801]|nr:hypothetical protein HDV02_004401 [Globomyces sp. JEL0801]